MTKNRTDDFVNARNRFCDFIRAIHLNETVDEGIDGSPFCCLIDLAASMVAGETVESFADESREMEIRSVVNMAESASYIQGIFTYRFGLMAILDGARKALEDMRKAVSQNGD